MIILLVIVLAIMIALLRGGRLSNFGDIPFRFFYLLFLPLVLQLIVFSPLGAYIPASTPLPILIYIASMFTGAVVVWLNRALPGFKFLLVGLLSNIVLIVLNGGYMPVSMAARAVAGLPPFTGTHNNTIEMTSASPLWFLGDLVPIPSWMPFPNVFSVGDVLIVLGGVWFIQRALVRPTASRPAAQDSSPVPSSE